MTGAVAYNPDRSLPAKLKRRVTQWRVAKPMRHTPDRAIVSFTFDDFPKSAAEYGASALDAIGAKGTYYVASGMAGLTKSSGRQFDLTDLTTLADAGHEIAAHTDQHVDCAKLDAATVRGEIVRNLSALKSTLQGHDIRQFAWPYGETRFDVKTSVTELVQTARGILPGINRKGHDLMQLRAFELTPDDATTARAIAAIEAAARQPGWVIVYTHDVRMAPSDYGTTPMALRALARIARDSGAQVLSVSAAMDRMEAAG